LPCADCARGIIQSGIKEVYIHKQFNDLCNSTQREQWKGHDNVTFMMFGESGVDIFCVDKVLGCKAYFDGKEFEV
jgi:deoxycytidylate deaminase